jgi:hypothetical protein
MLEKHGFILPLSVVKWNAILATAFPGSDELITIYSSGNSMHLLWKIT